MVKYNPGSGSSSTSEILQGDLAAQKRNATVYLDSAFSANLSFDEALDLNGRFDSYPQTPILDALDKYLQNQAITFHIPGHVHGEAILPKFKTLVGDKVVKLDTTDDFDGLGKLYPAKGPIKEAQELAAKAFGVEKTFFLINGSTLGNLALALTVTRPGKKVLMARNCHRSVISGITMSGAIPEWIVPERDKKWGLWCEINPASIRKHLEQNPDISAVWITNPTYEGVVTDVRAIANICKEFNVTFIVDEAHGTLWNFSNNLPESAVNVGADAVLHSIHKTGGSFSQSSMLHLGYNSKINSNELLSNLSILTSTSPSYLLLASLDAARAYLDSSHGKMVIEETIINAEETRIKLNSIQGCKCLKSTDGHNIDPTKIFISIEDITGKQLKDILEYEFKIETEARTDDGILALANIGNNKSELDYLYEVIRNIVSRKDYYKDKDKNRINYMPFSIPEMVCSPRDAYFAEKEYVKAKDSLGRISGDIIAVCPPGIPILVPGEKIQLQHLTYLKPDEEVQVIV